MNVSQIPFGIIAVLLNTMITTVTTTITTVVAATVKNQNLPTKNQMEKIEMRKTAGIIPAAFVKMVISGPIIVTR